MIILNIYSPISGICKDKDDIPGEETLENGDGIGIFHDSLHVCAYMDGKVTKVDVQNRIIHITEGTWGITVSLNIGIKSEDVTISPLIKEGDQIKQGSSICNINKPDKEEIYSALLILSSDVMSDKRIDYIPDAGESIQEGSYVLAIYEDR